MTDTVQCGVRSSKRCCAAWLHGTAGLPCLAVVLQSCMTVISTTHVDL